MKFEIMVCVSVGILGFLAAGLAFGTEVKKINASQVEFLHRDICVYPRSPAYGLGLGAACALLAAQVIVHIAGGLICCGETPCSSSFHWTISIISLAMSCFTFFGAFIILYGCVALNDKHDATVKYCSIVHPGLFAGAGVLCIISTIFSIIYYLCILHRSTRVFPEVNN